MVTCPLVPDVPHPVSGSCSLTKVFPVFVLSLCLAAGLKNAELLYGGGEFLVTCIGADGIQETAFDDDAEPALQKPYGGDAVVVEHVAMAVNFHDPGLSPLTCLPCPIIFFLILLQVLIVILMIA
ncbi:MAG TPA: hypothetical protein DCG53_08645 [Syntrophus sp. (in: bacteria)]|nr:hypothetical protein [Syntrophus sp. (in: bacteria)]